MAQQSSIRSLSESERYVVLERVIEYISDVRILMSLSLVSKRVRSAVYRSNGLHQLTCILDYGSDLKLNEVKMSYETTEEKLKNGLRWIWIIGKRLKTVELSEYDEFIALRLLNSLATTEKRRIETVKIGGMPYEWFQDLVKENCNTLRRLCVDLCQWVHSSLALMYLNDDTSEKESFWSVVQQCQRLESLELIMVSNGNCIFTVGLVYVLHHTPLKHLGLSLDTGCFFDSLSVRQQFVDVLAVENLRDNLESLEFDFSHCMSFLCLLVEDLAYLHTPVVFSNVTKFFVNFLELCIEPNPVNWLAFLTVLPAVKEIKNCFLVYAPSLYVQRGSFLSKSLPNFCKTYFEVSATRSRDLKIKISEVHYSVSNAQKLRALIAKATTLPEAEDQDWCTSHGVQIETETRDEKVESVTLRKDTSTLVFDLKFLQY